MEQHLHQQKWQVKGAHRYSFSSVTWHINAQAEQQLCERVCSAFTGTAHPAPHTLFCLSIFHLLMLAVWYSHSAHTRVPGSQLSPCLSSHKPRTLTWPFPYSLQHGINLRCTGQTSDTETDSVKKTRHKPSFFLVYMIWFIKQACESEALLGSTHAYHCFSYKEQNTAVQRCWQVPCHPPPSDAVSSEAWTTQETALIQQASSSQLSSELAVHQFQREFAPANFLSSHLLPHTLPAAPPTGLLDLWHTTNCSKFSFPQCIPSVGQWTIYNKAIICKPDVF